MFPLHTLRTASCGEHILPPQCSPPMQCSELLSPVLWLKEPNIGHSGALCLLAHQFFHSVIGNRTGVSLGLIKSVLREVG